MQVYTRRDRFRSFDAGVPDTPLNNMKGLFASHFPGVMYAVFEGERGLLASPSNRRQISGGGAKIQDNIARYPVSVRRRSIEPVPCYKTNLAPPWLLQLDLAVLAHNCDACTTHLATNRERSGSATSS